MVMREMVMMQAEVGQGAHVASPSASAVSGSGGGALHGCGGESVLGRGSSPYLSPVTQRAAAASDSRIVLDLCGPDSRMQCNSVQRAVSADWRSTAASIFPEDGSDNVSISCHYLPAAPTSMPYSKIERDMVNLQGARHSGDASETDREDVASAAQFEPTLLKRSSSSWFRRSRCVGVNGV
jgi:hypothetical protein